MAGPWVEELDEAECLDLLAGESVGRLAVVVRQGAPLVVPVNFVVDGRSVVFRSGYGAKLRGAVAHPASFQVDSFDPATRTGWSVLAKGRAREVLQREIAHLPLDPWVPDGRLHCVRLDIEVLTGRRLHSDGG
jgi:nitroimidazol reductase NimA-like FMN-containing flavoprotein (pyridoxamine 5'-phosphate oxidase superfamily)